MKKVIYTILGLGLLCSCNKTEWTAVEVSLVNLSATSPMDSVEVIVSRDPVNYDQKVKSAYTHNGHARISFEGEIGKGYYLIAPQDTSLFALNDYQYLTLDNGRTNKFDLKYANKGKLDFGFEKVTSNYTNCSLHFRLIPVDPLYTNAPVPNRYFNDIYYGINTASDQLHYEVFDLPAIDYRLEWKFRNGSYNIVGESSEIISVQADSVLHYVFQF